MLNQNFAERLLPWFQTNARVLPWRANKDPYRVWVSEIMLQQTRVRQAIDYYNRFIARLPTVISLAECDENELLKLWEGLGYYSRARNLHKTAKIISDKFNGIFPGDYALLRRLPGIGDYTAGTVGAICFNLPTPSVDGNVLRVITRFTASKADIASPETKQLLLAALQPVYEKTDDRGALIQAIMELGATVCVPSGAPKCDECPLNGLCKAHRLNLTDLIPVKGIKKEQTRENKTVFVVEYNGLLAVRKRPAQGLLAGLFEFPNTLGHLSEAEAVQQAKQLGFNKITLICKKTAVHVFTHRIWNMCVYSFAANEKNEDFLWTEPMAVVLPTAFKKLLPTTP